MSSIVSHTADAHDGFRERQFERPNTIGHHRPRIALAGANLREFREIVGPHLVAIRVAVLPLVVARRVIAELLIAWAYGSVLALIGGAGAVTELAEADAADE